MNVVKKKKKKNPGADEMVMGSPQNSADMTVHYACYEVMTSGS